MTSEGDELQPLHRTQSLAVQEQDQLNASGITQRRDRVYLRFTSNPDDLNSFCRPTFFPSPHSRAREGRDYLKIQCYRKVYVSIHAPARGTTKEPAKPERLVNVSIHAPARGATAVDGRITLQARGFNSRAREGCDKDHDQGRDDGGGFNSRAREGRDRARSAFRLPVMLFQFTRPRGARLYPGGVLVQGGVSIHAPARGATDGQPGRVEKIDVSIHAPARGATDGRGRALDGPGVSIHAPARGATPRREETGTSLTSFNSRAREGRDPACQQRALVEQSFNSRAREGRDRACDADRQRHERFNSRAREGRDFGVTKCSKRIRGFNSRAREGRDIDIRNPDNPRARFNSRAREGRDVSSNDRRRESTIVSIHAPARGATAVEA